MKCVPALLAVLLLAFSLAGCGGKSEAVQLKALEKNEALISGAIPCSTADEMKKAGIPMGDDPFDTQKNEENGLESVTYLLKTDDFTLDFAGGKVKSCFFQFINEKLSNITIELTDGASYEAVKAEMIKLYGEPAVEESMEGYIMNTWEFQADYPVRAAVIGRLADGEIVSGNFQVSYAWFETED